MRCSVHLISVIISGFYLRLVRILSNAFLYILGRIGVRDKGIPHQSICLYLASKIPGVLGMEVQWDREENKFSTNLISEHRQ